MAKFSITVLIFIFIFLFLLIAPCGSFVFCQPQLKILALFRCDSTDSALINYRQNYLDSLTTRLNFASGENIAFVPLEGDTFASSVESDSNFLKIGVENQAQLLLTGILQKLPDGSIKLFPKLYHFQSNTSAAAEFDPLASQICLPPKFELTPLALTELDPLVKFLYGYAHFYRQDFSGCLAEWQHCALPVCDYFKGVCYFKQMLQPQTKTLSQSNQVDSCEFYFNKCLLAAKTAEDSSYATNNLGVLLQASGKNDSASYYFKLADRQSARLPDLNARITISNNLANHYLLTGKWNQALEGFLSGISRLEAAKDTVMLAATFENLGNIYQLLYQRNKASEFYHQALELRKIKHDESGMAATLRCLGDIHVAQQSWPTARSYFLSALKLNQKLENEPAMAALCDRLGQLYHHLGYADSALFYFQQSVELYQLLDDKNLLVQALQHQATFFQNLKNYKMAEDIYNQALLIDQKLNNPLQRARLYDQLGDLSNNQNKLLPAINYYQRSAELYQQTENFDHLSLVYYSMGLIRLKQNNYEEGYLLLSQALQLDEQHGFGNLTREKKFVKQVREMLLQE